MNRLAIALATLLTGIPLLPAPAAAAEALAIKLLVERKVERLPSGPLFWRIETFPSRADAQAAAGPWSLVAESAGKIWRFTLGPPGGVTPGGDKAAELGPIPPVMARSYLLRINQASGSPGAVTPIHSHPGLRGVFRDQWGAKHPQPAWRDACGCGAGGSRPGSRRRDGGLEHRSDRPPRPRDVRGRCGPTVLKAINVALRAAAAAHDLAIELATCDF